MAWRHNHRSPNWRGGYSARPLWGNDEQRCDQPQAEEPFPPQGATGIQGLDEITGGGLPRGRPTLVCGSAGCGKTLLAIEFLVRGVTEFEEPGVFMAFEETARGAGSKRPLLGFDLEELAALNKLLVDYVHVERSEI
jgi:circadian clock protein KaiC